MWRLAQKMLSLAQHPLRKQTACSDTIEGSTGSFPSFQNPPRPPAPNFHLIRGGEGKMCSNFEEVCSLDSLCPEDNVSNKQISI